MARSSLGCWVVAFLSAVSLLSSRGEFLFSQLLFLLRFFSFRLFSSRGLLGFL